MALTNHEIDFADFEAVIGSPVASRNLAVELETPYLVVDLDAQTPIGCDETEFGQPNGRGRAGNLCKSGLFPKVVIGRTTRELERITEDQRSLVDLIAPSTEEAIQAVQQSPKASIALALILRSSATRSHQEGLLLESIHYSALQASTTHRAWLSAQPTPRNTASDQADNHVLIDRDDQTLRIVLNRPSVHNALNARMRNELLEALEIAQADPSISIDLRGRGPSFCSGGDLREFGLATDPANAHLTRLMASVGSILAELADRTEAVLHGSCVGAGIELPAFVRRIVAHPDTTFRLPELAFGLLPGAGGTVSIPRRIGRHRTMHMALMGNEIDAATALDYGLIDAIAD